MVKFIAAIALIAAIARPNAATADGHVSAATIKKVLAQHLAAFGAADMDAMLAEYAGGAVLMTPVGPVRGREALKGMFAGLFAEFARPGASFEMLHESIEGEVAYIVWMAETADNVYEVGADTFVIRHGKIQYQTFAGKITPKAGMAKDK